MNPALFGCLALIWSTAVTIKVLAKTTRGEPYQFATWDGGLTLRGRQLQRAGTLGFGAFSLSLLAVSVWLVSR